MTKHRKSLVNPNQLSLFDLLRQEQAENKQVRPGRLNISAQLNAAIKIAIRKVPKSRETIADEMTDLLGFEITVGMINNWTADSHPHRIPAEVLSAFCVATNNNDPLRIMSEAAGVFTMPGKDALRAEIQKLDEAARKLQTEKKKRLMFLQELEGGDLG